MVKLTSNSELTLSCEIMSPALTWKIERKLFKRVTQDVRYSHDIIAPWGNNIS